MRGALSPPPLFKDAVRFGVWTKRHLAIPKIHPASGVVGRQD